MRATGNKWGRLTDYYLGSRLYSRVRTPFGGYPQVFGTGCALGGAAMNLEFRCRPPKWDTP
jgi:hypothetical protein